MPTLSELMNYRGSGNSPVSRNRLSRLVSDPSVMDNYQPMIPQPQGLLDPAKDAIGPPTMLGGLLSLDPTDYIGPNTFKSAGAGLAKLASLLTGKMAASTPLLGAVTAWHGSPHMFDKFSLDKIGTGEGAQAYGHGLYLAEHPEVAKDYAKNLANSPAAHMGPDGAQKYKASLQSELDDAIKHGDKNGALLAQKSLAEFNTGNIYKTDLPEEAVSRFLDWDKPLSQQAPEVQAALLNAHPNPALEANRRANWKSPGWSRKPGEPADIRYEDAIDAGTIYNRLAGEIGSYGKASEALKAAGVPGIRYLDGGSRGAGNGTSNFVAFDPELIRILERNGQPTGQVPWKPGEWK